MDQETIKREASEALKDLELDSEVSGVTQAGKNWCIQFSGDYGQFCDPFQNQFEHDNSARVIREKVKKHLLGQITLLRNKGARKVGKKGFDDQDQPNLTELFQDAVTQTARAIGDVIDRTLGVTSTAIESAGDVTARISTGTAEALRPVTEPRPAPSPSPRSASGPAAPRKKSAEKSGKKSAKGAAKSGASKTKKRAAVKKKAATKKKGSRKG